MTERKPTKAGGWVRGFLPEGCHLCMNGAKMVYFMGADCSRPKKCSWYCPISNERKSTDSHFADELAIENIKKPENIMEKLLYEAKKIDAKGMSITGGDPLSTPLKVDNTIKIITGMKVEMGETFHIHLYTCGDIFNQEIAFRLNNAGLDSLRFHPEKNNFSKIEFALGMNYTVGAEVPVIPTEENHIYLMELADYLENIGADYLNLNEFEMVATNQRALQERGFLLKENSIASVKDSELYSLKFLDEFGAGTNINIHFCTAALKDGVQIRNRYIRRAKNVKRAFEEITEDGTLIFLRIKGGVKTITELYHILTEDSGVPMHLIALQSNRGYLDLPPFLSEDKNFIEMISEYNIKAGLLEILPFREEEGVYQEVEYTPINM